MIEFTADAHSSVDIPGSVYVLVEGVRYGADITGQAEPERASAKAYLTPAQAEYLRNALDSAIKEAKANGR